MADQRIYPEEHPVFVDPHPPQPSSLPKGPPPNKDFIYRPAPAYPLSRPPRRRRCSCLCWICSLLAGVILVIVLLALLFYLLVQPRLPKYRVQDARIAMLSLSNQTSPSGGPYLTSNITFTVIARNPNKRIGIYYGDVDIGLYYEGEEIGSGFIPPFYQGHKNTTVLVLDMWGYNTPLTGDVGSQLSSSITSGSSMPLRARIEGHVRVKIGKWKSRHVKVVVKCDVELIPSSPTTRQQLLSNKCKLDR